MSDTTRRHFQWRVSRPASFPTRRLAAVAALIVTLVGAGCARPGSVTGSGPTAEAGQAETDATTTYSAGTARIVVAYNDETANQATITYDAGNRKVLRGASLMGWSYSDDAGASWKYGGKVAPPPGWAVLWGDPAMTTSRTRYGWAYMSNLAFPDAKFPAGGISGFVGPAVGGACIARSTDGGVTFRHFQCVTNKDPIVDVADAAKGHFYDGGSMASGPRGEIFASFVDTDDHQIDIWRSPDGNAPFTRLPPPFPRYYVGLHPRIRVGPDGTLFVMTIARLLGSSQPYMLAANRFSNGVWGDPKLVMFIEVQPEIDFGTSVFGAPLKIRTGPQYSFDVGTASSDHDDSVRFMVTQKNDRGWFFIRGGICDYGLRSCGWYEGWTFGVSRVGDRDAPRLDVFNPNVAAFPGFFFGIAPRWQGSMLTRYGNATSTLNLTRGTLGYLGPAPFTVPVDIAKNAPVCSDLRGYWGDYDGFLSVQVDSDNVRFMRFMTDSSNGCPRRWRFVGEHQHVRAVDYWF